MSVPSPAGGAVPARFERARAVADAVLYEGYVLYPYRASARKNRVRFLFGVLAPRAWSEGGGSEQWWLQTECLVEPGGEPHLTARLRFLQLQRRRVEASGPEGGFEVLEALEAGGQVYASWDEAVEREADFELPLRPGALHEVRLSFEAGSEEEAVQGAGQGRAARVVRQRASLEGLVRLSVEAVEAPSPLLRLRARVENLTPWSRGPAPREEALLQSLLSVHTLLSVSGGRFVSLLEPPEWAAAAAAACRNVGTWPVLIGEPGSRAEVLSSPIILYDHPEVAPESPGDLYDATEIDEILTLRTLTLTDEEKREARATDPRAAQILDRVEAMPPETMEGLHGAIRVRRRATPASAEAPPPWWDPGRDASVDPERDGVEVGGVTVRKGHRVRLRPGRRRADAQDMFLAGRLATVEGVFFDVDQGTHLAVTLLEDPAAELHRWRGRYLYFAPDEVEPVEPGA